MNNKKLFLYLQKENYHMRKVIFAILIIIASKGVAQSPFMWSKKDSTNKTKEQFFAVVKSLIVKDSNLYLQKEDKKK